MAGTTLCELGSADFVASAALWQNESRSGSGVSRLEGSSWQGQHVVNPEVQISWQRQHLVDPNAQISWQVQQFLNSEMQISWRAQHFVSSQVQISWHGQHFVRFQVQISWQGQHFVKSESAYFVAFAALCQLSSADCVVTAAFAQL